MGIFFGLLTAVFFASGSIFVKIGQRSEPDDDGVYTTVFVNMVLLGLAARFAAGAVWSLTGVAAVVGGGVLGAAFGRSFMLRGVRLIGPARTSAFTTGTPVAAAVGGWIVLEETISLLEAVGGVITAIGLLWLVRSRASAENDSRHPAGHYLIAAAAPVFFGSAFVARKWGLERLDSSIVAAFLSAAAAFVFLSLVAGTRRELGDNVAALRRANIWFVLGGVATGLALLTQFLAFGFLEAWIVGLLVGTQGVWALAMSAAFLRGEEHIDAGVVGAVVVVALGVAVVALQT